LKRLTIRLKLTLVFAAVIAVVLGGVGTFLYLSFERDLSASVDQGLRSRAADVAALVRQADSGLTQAGRSPLVERGESFAQILDARGRVIDATPQLRRRPLLDASELATARSRTLTIERDNASETGEPVRVLATPVRAQGQSLVVVVGNSLEDNEKALSNLLALLLIGAPIALILASLAGYGVTAAALRPVEAMRRRAAEIGDAEPGQRLPVAEADDEIGRLGQTLNAMLDRLEAAFDRERTFVSDASHELRTPLAILKTELELALQAGRSREELVDALQSAAEETDRLARLAEDLLVIAGSDRGRLPVRLTAVDAGELLARVRERFARRGDQVGCDLRVASGAGIQLTADPLRMEQALGNVVDNALRHGAGAVRLSAAEHDGTVELRVSDEGRGFPDAFLGQAFERFTRADEARARGGSGLGLAIVDAIARAHGGGARAANRDGGGADVWIELPTRRPGSL
jgi:two-component system, OmpR family, sensor kinase